MNYAYERPDGSVIWRQLPISDTPPPAKLQFADGSYAIRSYRAERAGVPATSGWPLTCVASGVHADDAQKLRDEFKRVGVPTEVTSGGDPIYTDAAHRKRALKARGFNDRAGYY